MNLDELQSVQSRERQTDSLQQLRESFYRDAGEFIEQLRRERDRAAERADDPWNAPEVSRLNDDIDTAEGTVEAVYERRVGKIVKMASLAAADMPTEDDGLTDEEQSLFETLVAAIEDNRAQVEAILDGEDPAGIETSAPTDPNAERTPDRSGTRDRSEARDRSRPTDDPAPPAESGTADPGEEVDAADLMGGDGRDQATPERGTDPEPPASDPAAEPEPPASDPAADRPPVDPSAGTSESGSGPGRGTPDPGSGTPETPGEPSGSGPAPNESADRNDPFDESVDRDAPSGGSVDRDAPSGGSVDRETVRITEDVGEIFGVDDRQYDLTAEDVVTLPADNAEPLVDRDAAERLE